MEKFYTTSSVLYNENNTSNIPEWMQNVSDNIQEKQEQKIDLDFKPKGSFADSSSVNRTELDAMPRDIVADINNDKLKIDAKVKLAKFLIGKYYKTNTRIAGKKIFLDTTIDGLQANFTFIYEGKDGKVREASTFIVNESEYPFSKAGFDESLMDLKNGSLKTANSKVASSHQTYVINREEIIRRFNGSLREATNTINQHLNEGNIVGAGSNSYASFIDPNVLFPKLEKEIPDLPDGSFEFVDNREHVSANEYKSAKNLSFEASKILSNLFDDFMINTSTRDNNELLVNATVLNNGVRHKINFNFDINNEKVASLRLAEINDQRLSVQQLLDRLNVNNNLVRDYLKTSIASKRIYEGSILTEREIKNKLQNIVDPDRVDDFINGWIALRKIIPINSTTYTTNNSFEELLDMVVAETLTESERIKIANYKKKFGEGLDINRIEEVDTGVRDIDDVDITNEIKLSKINSALSRYFKNYQITGINNDIINAQFINNGIKHTVKISSKFNGQKLEKISAIINGEELSIDKLHSAFKVSPLLKEYLQDNNYNSSSSIIATDSNLMSRLSNLISNPQEVLNSWKKQYLTNIGGSLYTSKYTFEELLNKTAGVLLSLEEKQQIALAKQHFGKSFERIAESDNDTRDMISKVSNESLLYEANKLLSQHFANYTPKYFEHVADKDNSAKYTISLFDEVTGLTTDINLVLAFNGNTPISCKAMIGNELLELSNIKKAFAMNEALSKYLQVNAGKKHQSPMVITKNDLMKKLSSIADIDNIEMENLIANWYKLGKINYLNSNTLASKLSLEQLISMSNIKPLSDEEIMNKLDKSKRNKDLSVTSNYVNDNDTRELVERWTLQQQVIHAKSEIGSMFKDFDIIDANVDNNNYVVIARIVNPVNGLKKCLSFNFNTYNGTKLGNVETVSSGETTVCIKDILTLLSSNNEIINKFTSLNNVNGKSYKNIISRSNFKSKLLGIMDHEACDNVIEKLVTAKIMQQIDSNNFASEYSLVEMVEYLSNNNSINLKLAENKLKEFGKDKIVDTNIKHIQDSDNRQLQAKEQKLSPKMEETSRNLNKLIVAANENKKITNNKKDGLLQQLSLAKNPNDIENIWRELKKYI